MRQQRSLGIRRWVGPAVLVAILASVTGLAASDQGPEALHFSTFSLCAIDPATGQSGVAVTTRVPFVGRAVPWARAGVGAVATQSWTIVEYGARGLDMLAEGVGPEQVLERLLADDKGRELRQLGLINMSGAAAAFTGAENGPWAGSRQGENYTVQGNVLVGRETIDAVANHFEATAGSGMELAERMILALEAGQAAGGDKRKGNLQSAAIRVADPNDPGRGGDHLAVSIDVGEHAAPVQEMKRIYYAKKRRLGYREFSEVQGPDVVELKRMLHALGFWRKEAEPIPATPEFDVDRTLMRSDPQKFNARVQEFRQSSTVFMDAYGAFDNEVIEAVDAFRKAHAIDHPGNPRGLVDAKFVRALRDAFYGIKGSVPHE